MMLLAAAEHHARRACLAIGQALVERARGFNSYEAGDYLTRTANVDDPETLRALKHPAADVVPPAPAAGLPTSALLARSSAVIAVYQGFFDAVGVSTAEASDQMTDWTTELRDRAAQFAAHGD